MSSLADFREKNVWGKSLIGKYILVLMLNVGFKLPFSFGDDFILDFGEDLFPEGFDSGVLLRLLMSGKGFTLGSPDFDFADGDSGEVPRELCLEPLLDRSSSLFSDIWR